MVERAWWIAAAVALTLGALVGGCASDGYGSYEPYGYGAYGWDDDRYVDERARERYDDGRWAYDGEHDPWAYGPEPPPGWRGDWDRHIDEDRPIDEGWPIYEDWDRRIDEG